MQQGPDKYKKHIKINIDFRLKLPSKYANLVNELNTKAKDAGLGPIAEAVRDGFNLQDATSIQEIKSMEELKSIDEITHMKEIKSMQEIPDDVADKFIEVMIYLIIQIMNNIEKKNLSM